MGRDMSGRIEEYIHSGQGAAEGLDGDIPSGTGAERNQRPETHQQYHPCAHCLQYQCCHEGCESGLYHRADQLPSQ